MPLSEARITPRITLYQRWLAEQRGLSFATYDELWQWSVTDLDGFWGSLWDYFDLRSPTPHEAVLADERMPGARWFPGAQVNYVQQVFRHVDASYGAGHPAIVFRNEWMHEDHCSLDLSWRELKREVASLAVSLRRKGVQRGDRVAAYLPNTPQTVVAFLACASIGAVWSLCSPEMGPVAVLDRFRQIEPKVLIACDGSSYGGRDHDRRPVLAELLDGLPSVTDFILWPYLLREADADDFATPTRRAHDLRALLAGDPRDFEPEWLPFDHPLWIVYSSGTTGLPKPIVHSHGGIMLEALKLLVLHNNLGPTVETGDRFHWSTSTAWVMWNCQVNALLGGTTICLYDGSPTGRSEVPDWGTLWRFAAETGTTMFGAGAAFYANCLKAGVEPQRVADLSALRAVGSTGSPLSEECYDWLWRSLPKVEGRDIWVNPISGGTDFAGAFIAGLPTLPMVRGEMQCRCLGAAVESWSEPDAQGRGHALINEVGELVCTRPMPSMPLQFWNDPGERRYRESYFETYPGGRDDGSLAGPVWRHGDWIRIVPHPESGASGAVIYGRSDATINRFGVRMGTAEIYRAIEALPQVVDSLVVDLEYLGRPSWMGAFVVLREGLQLDGELSEAIRTAIRSALSPRYVPDEVIQVPAIPRTLSGKKMELPVKKLLQGAHPDEVLKRDAMANAASVDWFVDFAARRQAASV
jgi:acetoacetyl-CoA synthetase